MGLLDRIAARRDEQRATGGGRPAGLPAAVAPGPGLPVMPAPPVPPGPSAYQSAGVLPDTSSLAAWMQAQMADSGGLLTFRQ